MCMLDYMNTKKNMKYIYWTWGMCAKVKGMGRWLRMELKKEKEKTQKR